MLQKLEEKAAELRGQYTEVSAQYGPKFPRALRLQRQAHGAQHPQGILGEAGRRVAHAAHDSRGQVGPAVEGVVERAGRQVVGQRVHREVAVGQVGIEVGRSRVARRRHGRRPAVRRCAEGGDLVAVLARDDADGAELFAHGVDRLGAGLGRQPLDGLDRRIGRQVHVAGRVPGQHVAHDAADQVQPVPRHGKPLGEAIQKWVVELVSVHDEWSVVGGQWSVISNR